VSRGLLLKGSRRRLATLESLGAESLDDLTNEQIAMVVSECATYFHRQPYRHWFDPLNALLRVGCGASYYDDSACHLDVVQWATFDSWRNIPDGVRQRLLAEGVTHLRAQLGDGSLRAVLLNGRQVINQVAIMGLARLHRVRTIPSRWGGCDLYASRSSPIKWLGWSTNLQSGHVGAEFTKSLADWIAHGSGPGATEYAPDVPARVDSTQYLPQGMRLAGKRELVAVLRDWLAKSSAPTIGDVGSYGRRPWVVVEVGEHEVTINADTKRPAVEAFVRYSSRRPDQPWLVVPNRHGRVNKVILDPTVASAGWYAYVNRPLDAEGVI
jgi:hypothetical protein